MTCELEVGCKKTLCTKKLTLPYPYHPCMDFLCTFTIKIWLLWVMMAPKLSSLPTTTLDCRKLLAVKIDDRIISASEAFWWPNDLGSCRELGVSH